MFELAQGFDQVRNMFRTLAVEKTLELSRSIERAVVVYPGLRLNKFAQVDLALLCLMIDGYTTELECKSSRLRWIL